jgi:predicted ribosomally synthesized peptide with SipW-like signal peptide
MKRIVMSLGTLVFVAAVVAGGTGAFFSDTETSAGNVFTAGSVTLDLNGYTHQYLVNGDNAPDPVDDYFISPAPDGSPASFEFTDLKPLDNGDISAELVNGANDAFVCARITGITEESPFRDMLAFRTGAGPGGSFGDIVDALPLNTWFAPVPPSTPAPALAMDADQTLPVSLEYCFGEFEQGGGCVIDSNVDYNPAQGQTLTVDVEYYAVQQRNNEDFNCAGMNVVDPVVTTGDNFSPVDFDGFDFFAKSKVQEPNGASDFEVQVGVGDSDPADFDQGDTLYTSGQSYSFTLEYDGNDTATFTANGVETSYSVGNGDYENIGITLQAHADATTLVENLALSTGSLSVTSETVSDGRRHIMIAGADLNDGFTLTGDITLTWGSLTSNGENQKVQISVN